MKWTTEIKQSLNKLNKVRLSSSKNICIICMIKNPLKVMKKACYFILKALFVLKIFMFLSRLFGHVGEMAGLER